LVAVQQYFDYYILYQKIDVSGERNISFEEFTWAKALMEKNFGPIDDMKELFNQVPNQLQSGEIDFDEFCDWAILKSFKYQGLLKSKQKKLKKKKSKKRKKKILMQKKLQLDKLSHHTYMVKFLKNDK